MHNPLRAIRNIRARAQANGARDVAQRIARKSARVIDDVFSTSELDFPLMAGDVSDSLRLKMPPAPDQTIDRPLTVAWLCTPPGPGSGGHTTLFRMVAAMEARGHHCTLLLYNRHGTDPVQDAEVIRRFWPQLAADIRPMPANVAGFDVCIASSWETAHVLASRASGPSYFCYFVQDFEPYFYPRGSLYALAEDTYRFGFHHISIGSMVADTMALETGAAATVAPFGCDTDVYRLINTGPRSGVAFYVRPDVDRRGFIMARMALEIFHERNPKQPITTYGDAIPGWNVPHTHRGKLSPRALNDLYNNSLAAVAMSFTNVSLVAEEILAAGSIPIVNDSPLVRLDLSSPYVGWAPPTPSGIADALEEACRDKPSAELVTARSRSARHGWGDAQRIFTQSIEELAHTESTPSNTSQNSSLGTVHENTSKMGS